MKTIFITSFHVLISRNILATSLLELLRRRGVEVVLLVPEGKREFFVREFEAPGVSVVGVPTDLTRRDVLLRYLALAGLKTRTMAIKRRTEMRGSGEWLVKLIGNRSVARRLLRLASYLLTPRARFAALLNQHRPRLVFSTDLQNENDARLLHAAEDRGIRTVGMVRSWDNLTAKGLIRVVPDVLVVQNDIIRREAIEFHGIEPGRIRVVGIPHYDHYTRPAHPREEFARAVGLDPAKRFIVYAPTGDRYLAENRVDQTVVELLTDILPPTHQLLVRMPPADSATIDLGLLPANVRLHRPGAQLSSNPAVFKANELRLEDDDLLRDTLAYCDLVVAGPSTIIVDACVFDKPVILVGFDGARNPPYHESIRRYYDYNHMAPVARSGGVRIAGSAEELGEWVSRYLADPSLDRAARAKIVAEQCGKLDGQASERLGELLLGTLPHG